MSDTQIAHYCDQGPRDNLEDGVSALQISIPKFMGGEITIIIVVDGVGGNTGGEIASHEALIRVTSYLAANFTLIAELKQNHLTMNNIQNLLMDSVTAANQAILQRVADKPQLSGMSTTVVCAVIVYGKLYVVWAGDSRCYKYSHGELYQLTTDHSEVQKLIDKGIIDPAHADLHPLAHTINQFLGRDHGFSPSLICSDLGPGDVVLLCTDGLTDVLDKQHITEAIHKYDVGGFSLQRLPQCLVQRALKAGTRDNATALCCEYMPDFSSEWRFLDATLTGDYSKELAQSLRKLTKESKNVTFRKHSS